MNNDFWVTREAICQWKSLANRLTREPKIVIHGNSCIILYILYRGPESNATILDDSFKGILLNAFWLIFIATCF